MMDAEAATTDVGGGSTGVYEVIVVSYRSRPQVEELLAGLGPDVPVALVDNSHDADGLSELAAARPGCRYEDGPGTGYAAGANRGAATSRHPVVVFTNPDSRPSRHDIDRLVAPFAEEPDLAISCALKVDPDGRADIGVGGWEPTVGRALVHGLGAHKLFPRAGIWARPTPWQPIEVDWLGGACTAVPTRTFHALGGFDESYFVYSEDVEFGRTVREAGLRMRVRTDILVGNRDAGSGDSRPRMLQFRGSSMRRYVDRHNGPVRRTGIRLALTAGTALRQGMALLRGRRSTAEDCGAYLRGLRVGPPA